MTQTVLLSEVKFNFSRCCPRRPLLTPQFLTLPRPGSRRRMLQSCFSPNRLLARSALPLQELSFLPLARPWGSTRGWGSRRPATPTSIFVDFGSAG